MTFRADAARMHCLCHLREAIPQRVPAMLVVAVARPLGSARSWLRHRAFGSAFFRSRQTTGIAGHISDKRLAALIDVHMLDTHELGAALAQMPESLDLGNIGPHQPGCGGRQEPCAA